MAFSTARRESRRRAAATAAGLASDVTSGAIASVSPLGGFVTASSVAMSSAMRGVRVALASDDCDGVHDVDASARTSTVNRNVQRPAAIGVRRRAGSDASVGRVVPNPAARVSDGCDRGEGREGGTPTSAVSSADEDSHSGVERGAGGGLARDARPSATSDVHLADDVRTLLRDLRVAGGSSASPWSVDVASVVLDVPGSGVVIPDLVLQREGRGPVYVELLGFWSRDAVWRRVELAKSGALGARVVFCANARLRVSEAVLEGGDEAALYVWKGKPSARALLERVERLAAPASSA